MTPVGILPVQNIGNMSSLQILLPQLNFFFSPVMQEFEMVSARQREVPTRMKACILQKELAASRFLETGPPLSTP